MSRIIVWGKRLFFGLGWVLAIIGVGGIPDDIATWGRWLAMLEVWIDSWWVRVCVASVGLGIITYPQWLPRWRTALSKLSSKSIQQNPSNTELSPKELCKKFKGLTDMEVKERSKPYIDQKIRLNLTVENVDKTWPGLWFHGYTVDGRADDGASISADFPSKWRDNVSKLRIGHEIIVDGEIRDISDVLLFLGDCKIMTEQLVPDL